MRKHFFTLFFVLIAFSGMAQKLPDWIINKPTPTNNTYLYVVESATGQTELQARNRAIGEVFRSTAMRIGQPIDSEEINRALQRGTEYYVISSQYNVPINKVCEYTDNKTSPCRVYVLCQVAKAGDIHVEFDEFNACYEGNNKVYADEALYAKDFDVYRNGVELSEGEIRTMFANSRSYDLYDKGKRIERFINEGTGVLSFGGLLFVGVGGAFQTFWDGYDSNYGWDSSDDKGIVITGLTMVGLGIGMWAVALISPSRGKAKIRKAVNLYNNGRMYSQGDIDMEYGLGGNGVYLTFLF